MNPMHWGLGLREGVQRPDGCMYVMVVLLFVNIGKDTPRKSNIGGLCKFEYQVFFE